MKKFLLPIIFIISITFIFPALIDAAKLKASQRIGVATYKTARDVRVTFRNLGFAKKVAYELTYTRLGGARDGAGGVITPKGKAPVVKTLTLGTCSARVCTYHKGIKNIKLKVTAWYSPSLTVETKTYSIK